jgi:hypothetical protein
MCVVSCARDLCFRVGFMISLNHDVETEVGMMTKLQSAVQFPLCVYTSLIKAQAISKNGGVFKDTRAVSSVVVCQVACHFGLVPAVFNQERRGLTSPLYEIPAVDPSSKMHAR